MGWIDPTDRVNGDVLDANLWNQDVVANTLAIFRHLNPVGTVIPYAGDWGANYVNLADPDVGAPFHLPCTGGIYETADFPLLSRVLGHTFAPLPPPGSHTEGDIAGGEHLVGAGGTDADGNPYIAEAVYRYQTSPLGWKLVVADGFIVPDLRGRSPIGTSTDVQFPDWGTQPVAPIALGVRKGDWRLFAHSHEMYTTTGGTGPYPAQDRAKGNSMQGGPTSVTGAGTDHNWHPVTGVNFLIFTGQVVTSHAPKSTGLRDGSAYRIQPVTTEHMIHQRLADPNISDDEREMWEAQLNGEPWPPMEVS